MKKINSIILALLIVMSAFAGAIASVSAVSDTALQAQVKKVDAEPTSFSAADENESEDEDETEEEEEDSVDVDELLSSDLDDDDIDDAIKEFKKQRRYRNIGFANIWRGHGWIENDDEGYMINGFWITHTVLTTSSEAAENEDSNSIRSVGRLLIGKHALYKLVKTDVSTDTAASVNFYVVPIGIKLEDADAAEKEAVGRLRLVKLNEYDELTTWSGTLTFDNGQLEGSWDVELGTTKTVIKTGAGILQRVESTEKAQEVHTTKAAEIGETQKKPFWRRLFFWWG